ncbi:hypothetical protein ACSLO7_31540, partial [Klebsiella pneumoniae]
VAPGQPGELCIKGPQVMLGYWQRPDATDEIIKDGWLHTGDIAWVGDQQILPAQFDKQQAVHGQGENVIQRQRGHHELFAA